MDVDRYRGRECRVGSFAERQSEDESEVKLWVRMSFEERRVDGEVVATAPASTDFCAIDARKEQNLGFGLLVKCRLTATKSKVYAQVEASRDVKGKQCTCLVAPSSQKLRNGFLQDPAAARVLVE